jgi:putative ABC transport system permease protein
LKSRNDDEARMNREIDLHIEMEAEHLIRTKGLTPEEARRQALIAFGGVETHKEALRDGRGLAWLAAMSLDLKLASRMLVRYPALTFVGGLALAIAIGVGAGWYDLTGKFLSPTIPLPDGDRLVVIEMHNTLTNEPEPRVARDFLGWRRELRTIEGLGAFRTDTRNLVVDNAAPKPIRVAALTAAAFAAARVRPTIGRGLLDADDAPGSAGVIVLGYHLWQRTFGGRQEVVGSVVRLGSSPATVVGVMPKGFAYPLNHAAWTALPLRDSYGALEGDALGVIGRLAAGATKEQADAELRGRGEGIAAVFPETHRHLMPRVRRLGETSENPALSALAMRNLPVLVILAIACVSVGTLVYARTATREEEIAVRSALGASRMRIVGQLFVEALVLASIAAAVGLLGADRAVAWAVANFNQASGGVPFWITPGLKWSTMVYAAGLAAFSAMTLSMLPALRATRTSLQMHLTNRGTGGATLRFGRVWTAAMILQVAVTAVAIPGALEGVTEAGQKAKIRSAFPGREYLAARIDTNRPGALAELQRRIAEEPGVVSVTFADRVPGTGSREQSFQVESAGASSMYVGKFRTSGVGPGFFQTLDRPIVNGRAFGPDDWIRTARTVIVNEQFAREFSRHTGLGSPVGARVRHADSWSEIVGVVRNIGLDPDDLGVELPFVFHAASEDAVSPFVLNVRVRGDAASLATRLPAVAADVDANLIVQSSRSMEDVIRGQDESLVEMQGAAAGLTSLGLLLSTMSIFALVSVNVSRRRREIGVRTALGATRRQLLAGILSRAVLLTAAGTAVGAAGVLLVVARGGGPSGRAAEDVPRFAVWIGMTCAVMLVACLLACVAPARRALKISPSDALKET